MFADVQFPIDSGAFTYLVPEELMSNVKAGSRVLAPFRRAEKVGIVVGVNTAGPKAGSVKLKKIKKLLDDEPIVSANLLKLIKWVGHYYISSHGVVLKNALPSSLFTGKKVGKQRVTYDNESVKKRIRLTEEQENALNELGNSDEGVFLLHGVTGSGKTEVYIRAIKALPENEEAIVLVPEIAITAQMVGNFQNNFGDGVVFYHSGLSAGERLSSWNKMQKGEVKVVVGVRSAVFSPFRNLGLIVVDEEQESSYKQFDGLKYNARDVALVRAQLEKMKVILGSATPSLESFYNAEKGKFRYLELKHRIDKRPMPLVQIVDMRDEELKSHSISKKMLAKIKEKLALKEQSLMLLNRRGYSPFLICGDCSFTYRCHICSITLTYHKGSKGLNCHYCGSFLEPGDFCPECKSPNLKYIGAGVQKIEEEITDLVPGIRVKRMDRDTTGKKLAHYRIVKDMEQGKIDLLLGTQMVAKGHDLPDVTLAGVISADVALNLPDFRSAERAFQLFTQLAGRAGRGRKKGEVLIQTLEPDHYVFDYVKGHDYKGFYKKELAHRKELAYPPFSKLVRVLFTFKTRSTGERVMSSLSKRLSAGNGSGVEVLGPVMAPIEKIKNMWRWHLLVKGKDSKTIKNRALEIADAVKNIKEMKVDIDVDPINMM